MNRIRLIFLPFLFLATLNVSAQSIRKNYQEMTQSERDALVNAFHTLRSGLINDLATFHSDNFSFIHFNLPEGTSTNLDVFFEWHRRQIFELEQAIQGINPKISIPFWDWTVNRSSNDLLWDEDFLGQFESDPNWNINRVFDDNITLPTTSDVLNIQSETDWLTYSNTVERGIHATPHRWVGGTMGRTDSPRDPVFYLHHGMIDKLWQDWVEANGITPNSNIYQRTSLPRYPSVNPNDIVDSRVLGVFFAENELAQLNNYTIRNTENTQETFYYQYTIEAGNHFVIPNGKNAMLESVNEVILNPGFDAQYGSVFVAQIDVDNNMNTNMRLASGIKRKQKPFDNLEIIYNAYDQGSLNNKTSLNLYPNPTNQYLTIEVDNSCTSCELEIFNVLGLSVIGRKLIKEKKMEIDLSQLGSGFFLIKIYQYNELVSSKKFIKQ